MPAESRWENGLEGYQVRHPFFLLEAQLRVQRRILHAKDLERYGDRVFRIRGHENRRMRVGPERWPNIVRKL